MAGRRSVWSDPRVIALAREFVPATDEVWRLQRGTDAECRHFQRMAHQGHYGGGGGTKQGIYVASPSGELLASINHLSPQPVIDTLESGLEKWSALPANLRGLPADARFDPTHRWEWSYPEDGLVLKSYCRDLPPDDDPASPPPGDRWNLDHVWFTAEEARGWLPAEGTVGSETEVSPLIVERLAGYHLVDNVRGQTIPFGPGEHRGSWIRTRVEAVRGDELELSITGETQARSDGEWSLGENDWTPRQRWPRSLRTRVAGKLVYDRAQERFTAFELVALGQRSGRTRFNGRHGDESGAIGFYFTLAPDRPSERVAPAFVDIYNAAWIQPSPHPTPTSRHDEDG